MDSNKQIKLATIAAYAIRDAKEVPAGHLYAALMAHDVTTLSEFEGILQILKNAKLIKESGFLLTWIGPVEVTN